jgi:uncharacterized RDD family membrane protein YckC
MNKVSSHRLMLAFAWLCASLFAVHADAKQAGAAAAAQTTPAAQTPAGAQSAGAPQSGTSAHGSASPQSSAAASAAAPSASWDSQGDNDDEPDADSRSARERARHHHAWKAHEDGDLFNIGDSSHLLIGQKADSVVSIFGSATSDGEADDVVSVFGNTRVTGHVTDSAVAVLGDVYIDSKVDGDVVSVLGNVELGPNAEVGGDVVSVLGQVRRDADAIVHGSVQSVISVDADAWGWLSTWIHRCLLYGRPLAFAHGLGWAWTLALGFLAFYTFLALLFRTGIDKCVHTLETQPGRTALAALLAMLLSPVLVVLLCITVIGIAAVPFAVAAWFCVALFGKAVMLAWIGGRISQRRPGPTGHPAVAVIVGGAIVLLLYVIPVVGFLVYKLLGFFGFGAVIYTLILAARARRGGNGGAPVGANVGGAAGANVTGASVPGSSFAGVSGVAGVTGVAGAAETSRFAGAAGSPDAGAGTSGAGGSTDATGTAGAADSTRAVPPYVDPPLQSRAAPAAAVPHITAAIPRAGFWIRMGALFLDVLLIGVATSLVHPFGNFHLVLLAIYGAIMWKLRGTTVGGIVFDLHVVRMDGRPVDWETAIVRALGCFLSLAVAGLGFIWIAFDHDRQAWHDKIAGTVVVRAKRGVPLL